MVTLVAWAILAVADLAPLLQSILLLGAVVSGLWAGVRGVRWIAEKAVWRLRHRLIITYLFIAVAPVVLLILLGLFAGYSLLLQVAMNTVTAELDDRGREIASVAESIAKLPPDLRTAGAASILQPYFTDRYHDISTVIRQQGREGKLPATAAAPDSISQDTARGIVRRGETYFLWAYRKTLDGDVTVTAPLSHALLDQLAPDLGLVDAAPSMATLPAPGEGSAAALPPATGQFDAPFFWFALLRSADWQHPDQPDADFVIALQTRISAVVSTVFSRKADVAQGLVRGVLIAGAIVFVFVELICWAIGVSMTRTITGTVHHLYEGTQQVMTGKLSHRIAVQGGDQLAEVGTSFNRMTAHLEQLVTVAKEKERMQSELEIAHEVQSQLYPRLEPCSSHLRVAAICKPARTVSGDYFDYAIAGEGQVALAVGDVAGKGISAALLMASLQSSLRTQLQSALLGALSTADVVARVNRHLCSSSTPDKYATFFLGIYDEPSSNLVYTNAGHLPPVLIRGGQVLRLEVDGTVVGAFPQVSYGQSHLTLEPGDLVAWFTDGVTEPESEFGEMFGEDRLIDLLVKNAHRDEQDIVHLIVDAVRQWTGSEELQDDIT
ncbi:MAG: hypothetical protein RL328_1360, partial [Acidobacteriota bacterium]